MYSLSGTIPFNYVIITITIFLIIQAPLQTFCKSEFVVVIKQYRKESNRMLDGRCCGKGSVSDTCSSSPCAHRFRICLEYVQASVNVTDPRPYSGPCAHGSKDTNYWGMAHMTYSEQYAPKYQFDIKHSWPGEIQIIIEVYDAKDQIHFRNSIIDRFTYRSIIQPSKSDSEWHTLTKLNGASIYSINFRLRCSKNYYGPHCDKLCKSGTGNFRCDANGNMICHTGWMGVNCNTTICKAGCHPVHGYCNKPGECLCTQGWSGPFCDECIKYPGCLHGSCIDSPWSCYCYKDWTGHLCDKSLNYCAENNPCKNGGICENKESGSDPYICICPSGYTGKNCEIDPCLTNPCKKGTCLKTKKSFYCQCFDGWAGKYCDRDTSVCDEHSCQNGGTCKKDIDEEFRCQCLPGFRGSECHLAESCMNSRCKHAIDCEERSRFLGTYSCRCQDGWTGQFCDINIDDCKYNPCKNGGICEDKINDYFCKCKEGYKGKNCEVNVVCISKPCKNNGVCQETDTGFICKCKKGYSGKYCEVYRTGCRPNPCRNGAYCYTMENDKYFCQCPKNYYGKHCQFVRPYCGSSRLVSSRLVGNKLACATIHDPCANIPPNISRGACGPYGTCVPGSLLDGTSSIGIHQMESAHCKCAAGLKGKYCEINEDNCKDKPCLNGGVCIDDINDFHCLCDSGFHGKKCEFKMNYCTKNPCLNEGLCKQISIPTAKFRPPDFKCECPSSWGGRLCHQPIESVCNDNPCLHNGKCVPNNKYSAVSSAGYSCLCQPGWLGTVCQYQDIMARPCSKNVNCQNGGVCINVGDSDFVCHCQAGYEGRHCETNINECHPNPCFNGGTCVDLINAYKCECPKGFFGINCQTNYDDCASYPCAYDSVCIDRIDGFECRCPVGRSGKLCDNVDNYVEPPRPPSCVFENRIFDSGETWSYNCQNCRCNKGKTVCEKTPCGVWSCLKASGPDDPYACKPGETCHAFHFDPSRCFVPPCVPKAVCIRTGSKSLPPDAIEKWPPPTKSYCRPNGPEKNNYCAKIRLLFDKSNIPIGVTVDDLCNGLKDLKIVRRYKNDVEGHSLAMSCDVDLRKDSVINVAVYSSNVRMRYLKTAHSQRPFVHYLSDTIADDLTEVIHGNYTPLSGLVEIRVETLLLNPEENDSSAVIKYLIIPIIFLGLLFFIIIVWHHKKKMVEIREKYSNTQINYNNALRNSSNKYGLNHPSKNSLKPSHQVLSFYNEKRFNQNNNAMQRQQQQQQPFIRPY